MFENIYYFKNYIVTSRFLKCVLKLICKGRQLNDSLSLYRKILGFQWPRWKHIDDSKQPWGKSPFL